MPQTLDRRTYMVMSFAGLITMTGLTRIFAGNFLRCAGIPQRPALLQTSSVINTVHPMVFMWLPVGGCGYRLTLVEQPSAPATILALATIRCSAPIRKRARRADSWLVQR